MECSRKDDFAKHQTEVAKEAVAGKLLISCANVTSAHTHILTHIDALITV